MENNQLDPRDPGTSADVIPELLHLGKLLERITEGRFRVPHFQRPFVWRPGQMIELLDSVRRRYPIGSILIWESKKAHKSWDTIGPLKLPSRRAGETASYILDGQQRLSTLAGTLRLQEAEGVDWRWRVYFDLEEQQFYHPRDRQPRTNDLAAWRLFDTFEFLKETERILTRNPESKARELIARAERLADSFRNYQLPLVRIADASLSATVRIFARVNSRGTPITADQMISALTYDEDSFNLSTKISEILSSLKSKGFGDAGRTAILRSVLAAAGADIYDTDWTMLVEDLPASDRKKKPDLQKAVVDAGKSLQKAVEFLETLGASNARLLPYSLQLVLLSEFFRLCPEPQPSQEAELSAWFWKSSFTGHFATFNSVDSNLAISEMRELATGKKQAIQSVTRDPLPFPSRFDARSARVRAFLLFLFSLRPLSFEGTPIFGSEELGSLGPQALRYIIRNGLARPLQSSPANRILLPATFQGSAKNKILDLPQDFRKRFCVSHGISELALRLLQENRFADFVEARRSDLIQLEREFMQSKGFEPFGADAPPEFEPFSDSEVPEELDYDSYLADLFGDADFQ